MRESSLLKYFINFEKKIGQTTLNMGDCKTYYTHYILDDSFKICFF